MMAKELSKGKKNRKNEFRSNSKLSNHAIRIDYLVMSKLRPRW